MIKDCDLGVIIRSLLDIPLWPKEMLRAEIDFDNEEMLFSCGCTDHFSSKWRRTFEAL